MSIFVSVLAIFPVSAKIKTVRSGNYSYWLLKDNTAKIVKYHGKESDVTIPAKINGHKVTAVTGLAFRYKKSIKSITISNGITNVESWAFYVLKNLETINIPASVKEFSGGLFMCTSVTDVNVHKDNKYYCSENGIVFNKDKTTLVLYPANYSGEEYIVPNTVKKIGKTAFAYNRNLVSVTMQEGVKEIDKEAFHYCKNLANITFPTTLEKIYRNAFWCSDSIKNIYISDFDKWCEIKISKYNYYDDEDAPWSVLGMTYNKNLYLNNTLVTDVVVSKNANQLSNSSLAGFKCFKSITVSEGVTEIPYGAFAYCKNVTELNLPESLKHLGDYAFCELKSLEKIDFPKNLYTIGYCAFEHCNKLESITIPENIQYVETYAFLNCKNLKRVTIYGNAEFQNSVFSDCKLLETAGPIGSGCNIEYEGNNISMLKESEIKKVILPNDTKKIPKTAFWGCNKLESIKIPNTVTEIGEYAFSGCISLKSVVIPDSVKAVGGNAFDYCIKLEKVKISQNVEHIKAEMFEDCRKLKKVVIPDSVKIIGRSAFSECDELEKVKIGSNVEHIKREAFYECRKLKKVVIPKSVKRIDKGAFGRCFDINASDIYNGKAKGFRIVGYPNSAAEKYAKKNGFKFVTI